MNELLRRVFAENRSVVLTLVVALVANIAMYALVVRPRGVKAAGAADRAAAAAGAVRAAELELAAARALVEGKRRADEELNAFYQRVLPADLSAARRMTYASLPALARKTKVRYEQRRSSVEEPNDEARLGRLAIRMVLQGEYESLRNFIFQLESAAEFVIIDDVTLTESNTNEPETLTIDLSTYFRLRPNGA
jgi:Type II secretion system (T2SS), protein M subtype b